MGSRFSSETTKSSAVDSTRQPTAKVVAADGSLTEYAAPISATDALGGASAGFFLCNSDRLYFDAAVPALGPGDLLRPGQLYFVLPLALRGRALSGLDMAALAVKASAALGPPSSKKRPRSGVGRRVTPVQDAPLSCRVHLQHSFIHHDNYDGRDPADRDSPFSTSTISPASSSSSSASKKKAFGGARNSDHRPPVASRRLRRILSTIQEDAE